MQTTPKLNTPPPPGEGFEVVTPEEFFAAVGKLDVHPHIVGKYPFTCLWKTPGGHLRGKTVDYYTRGNNGLTSTLYCLPN